MAAKERPRERLREIEEDIFFGPSASTSNRAKDRDREKVSYQLQSHVTVRYIHHVPIEQIQICISVT